MSTEAGPALPGVITFSASLRDTSAMTLMLKLGEKVTIKGRTHNVSETAVECLPRVRDHLIECARARRTITYGELVSEVELTYRPQGLGWLMNLLSVDCQRRDEPSLAALVVRDDTGEVGHDFEGDAEAERDRLFAYWATPSA